MSCLNYYFECPPLWCWTCNFIHLLCREVRIWWRVTMGMKLVWLLAEWRVPIPPHLTRKMLSKILESVCKQVKLFHGLGQRPHQHRIPLHQWFYPGICSTDGLVTGNAKLINLGWRKVFMTKRTFITSHLSGHRFTVTMKCRDSEREVARQN